ncbi:MAG TPA: MoxR family ATPase [Gemmataceae bacterium]|jgi:MoxR-like ATPase|nr:MoxR family ATPase [Gemmataceae bacterium]
MEKPIPSQRVVDREDAAAVARLGEARRKLKAEIAKVVVGQDAVLDALLMALLCRGHVLMLGVPGLGKTLMARTIARALDMDYRRIQFTPDLMPSDITGTDIIEEDPETGRRKLEFFQGPLFTNFLLADEINRAPPKTQAALLQAMQELEVSVGRRTYRLEPPFFVVATQNPVEQEGTYPLPEAQLDRFMFNVPVTYPSAEEEVAIVKNTTTNVQTEVRPVLTAAEVLRLQELVRGVPVADAVVRYAVQLVGISRPGQGAKQDGIHRFIRYGASPRAAQYLTLGAKARAVLRGHFHVDFADVRAVAIPVLRHRLVLNFHARAEGIDADALVHRLIKGVPEK